MSGGAVYIISQNGSLHKFKQIIKRLELKGILLPTDTTNGAATLKLVRSPV